MSARSEIRIAAALGAAAFALYLSNFRVITDGDSIPARYIPFAIWGASSVSLDSVAVPASRHSGKPPYWLLKSADGRLVSLYPIVTPVLVAPFYAPLIPHMNTKGWTPERVESLGIWMEKLSAAAIASASVAVVFFLLRRRLSVGRALLLAAAYGAGTGTWPVSSQALWQHGMAQLLLAVALLIATTRAPARHAAWIGLLCGLLAANRPPDALLAVALAAGLVWRRPRLSLGAWLRLFGGALAGMAPFLYYNWTYFKNLAGGYGAIGLAGPHPIYGHPIAAGIAGLLVSPAKGLFVFSPFLLFLFAPRRRSGGVWSDGCFEICLFAGLLIQIFFYARFDWRAGNCYGPRYLLDGLPVAMWLLAGPVERLHAVALRAFVVCAAVAVVIQAVGAYDYPSGRSDDRFYPVDVPRLTIPASVWSWSNAPFVVEARAGPAKPDLFFSLRDLRRRRFGSTPVSRAPLPPDDGLRVSRGGGRSRTGGS